MSALRDRRGFLRSLAALPLIGGGVTIVGNPTKAAIPPTPGMLATYVAWLDGESRTLGAALGVGRMVPCVDVAERFHRYRDLEAEGRAAIARAPVMLAAAGCRLTSWEAEKTWGSTFSTAPVPAATAPRDDRRRLLSQYETWLGIELGRVSRELRPATDHHIVAFHGPAFDWHKRRPGTADMERRAAMLLATVRCDWRVRGHG